MSDLQLIRYDHARRALAEARATLAAAAEDLRDAELEHEAAAAALVERIRVAPAPPAQLALEPAPDHRPWSATRRRS